MSDPHTPISEILAELHEALEVSADLNEDLRADLRDAATEIQQALDQPGPDMVPASLRDRLSASLDRFEGSHPRLTAIVGRIADALSDLGI